METAPTTARSKRTALVRIGGALFRWRDYTPIPFLIAWVVFAQPTALSATVGLSLMACGEAIRVASVRHIRGSCRTRGTTPGRRLIESGPFCWTRNPLYLGNASIALGTAFLSGRWWAIVATLVLFVVQYVPIVRWEEEQLRRQFGEEYAEYRRRVPRWFPRPRRRAEGAEPIAVREAMRIERRTLVAILVTCALFLARWWTSA
ncbi:DUF1295 domain-containing protein [Candidatus Poribacteria bacterium]|nr:DUF1295 domain-containing protein [Candidatus Poribacteria bacterium]